jgi:peptidoglycan hydrolase CwlO-like protein
VNPEVYKKWWQLHLRKARGEALNSAESAEYQDGLKILEAEEQLDFADAGFQKLRGEIANSLSEIQSLQEQNRKLDEEIGQLAKALEKTPRIPEPIEG